MLALPREPEPLKHPTNCSYPHKSEGQPLLPESERDIPSRLETPKVVVEPPAAVHAVRGQSAGQKHKGASNAGPETIRKQPNP